MKKAKKAKKAQAISYHMKCAKTANGLTHFVMYGDVPKKNASVRLWSTQDRTVRGKTPEPSGLTFKPCLSFLRRGCVTIQ